MSSVIQRVKFSDVLEFEKWRAVGAIVSGVGGVGGVLVWVEC